MSEDDIFAGEQRFAGDLVELRDGKVRYARQLPGSSPVGGGWKFENPELVWAWWPGIDPPKMPMGAEEVQQWWSEQNARTFNVQASQ